MSRKKPKRQSVLFTIFDQFVTRVFEFFVTGILFRPEGAKGKRPAVLCPHGHGGRLQTHSEVAILNEIKIGAEKFKESGRMPKVARAVTLARLGNVVLLFDMIGYADSVQLSYQLAHRFAKQRPEMEGKKNWGIYSTQAELRLQSIMGLQTWNGIRALDFLASLPDVLMDDSAAVVTDDGPEDTELAAAPRVAAAVAALFQYRDEALSSQGRRERLVTARRLAAALLAWHGERRDLAGLVPDMVKLQPGE